MASGISSGQKPTGVTDLDSVQTLENKTLDSSNAINGSTITSADIVSPNRADVKKGLLADLQTYAATGDGGNAVPNGQLCFATDEKEMYQVVDGLLQPVGGGASGTSIEISQTTHGFAVGDGIYHNGTSWVKGQANDGGTLATFAVTQVPDADNFVAYQFGRVTATGHGFTIGEYYFLSTTVAGQPTSTEPTSDFSNPLFYVEDANTLQVLVYRPSVVGNQTSIDELSDVSVPTPSDNEVLTYVAANSRFESQSVNSANVTYDNAGSTLAATDVDAAIDEVDGKVELKANADGATITNASIQSPSRLDVRKATQSELETYAGTADNGQLVFATDEKRMYQIIDNQLKNVGGSAGIGGNLMTDFEDLTPTTSNVTSTVDDVTFLPIDDNDKSIKATWSGSVGSIQYDVPLDASLQEIQGTVSVWIKTSLADMQISSVQDGTKISTLAITGNNKWRQYEIPMVLGGSNIGFIVESLTAQTGDVFIDEVFVGLTPSSYAFDVAQSQIAESTWTGATGCSWSRSGSGSYGGFPADADCNNPTVTNFLKVPPSKIPAITLPAGSPAGTYEIVFSGAFLSNTASSAAGCYYRMSDGTTQVESGLNGNSGASNPAGVNLYHNTINGSFTYNSALTSDTTIEIFTRSFGANTCQLINDTIRNLRATVKYYPPQSTIVTQAQSRIVVRGAGNSGQLITAATEPIDFTVIEDTTNSWSQTGPNGTDTFTAPETGDYYVSGNVRLNGSSDIQVQAYVDNVLKFPLGGNVGGGQSHNFGGVIRLIKGEALTIRMNVTNTIINDSTLHNIHIQKLASDAAIVGNFEQIKTTELVKFVGNPSGTVNAATGVATTVNLDEVEIDNNNAYDSVNNYYVIPKDSTYQVCVNAGTTGTGTGSFLVYALKNGTTKLTEGRQYLVGGRQAQPSSCKVVQLSQGDNVRLEVFQDMGATAGIYTGEAQTFMTIEETPDVASIVKNLNDNKTVKYQKKLLTTSSFSDVNFSNLVIGKKYRVKTLVSKGTGTAAINMEGSHDGQVLVQNYLNDTTGRSFSAETAIFTATATTFTFGGSGVSSILVGEKSYVEIIEYPDYYIETNEF